MNAAMSPIIFKDSVVRPGHAITLACLIMQLYPSLAAAKTHVAGTSVYAALKDERIPGTGHAVFAALDVLKRGFVLDVDAAIDYADSLWQDQSAYSSTRRAGQLQADSLKAQFREMFARWADLTSS